jgi:hypothetical protein
MMVAIRIAIPAVLMVNPIMIKYEEAEQKK